jgi:hypothetical protein
MDYYIMVLYMEIMKALDYPPVFLIPPEQFAMLEGPEKKEDNSVNHYIQGIAAVRYPVLTVNPDLHGLTLINVIWHEVGHHLWPWKPHWWIEMFGEKMANGGGRGYWSARYNKTPDDLPSRSVLLKLARRQAKKLKEKYKIKKDPA